MPIRPRITDPYGEDAKAFDRRRKHGAAPKAPRKPSKAERDGFVRMLKSVPIGKRFTLQKWRTDYLLPYMKQFYTIWGVELAVYPASRLDNEDMVECTGISIRQLKRNRRTGQQPVKLLKSNDREVWYGQVIRWIEDTCYSD